MRDCFTGCTIKRCQSEVLHYTQYNQSVQVRVELGVRMLCDYFVNP